jgi:uncharacterized membrane protein
VDLCVYLNTSAESEIRDDSIKINVADDTSEGGAMSNVLNEKPNAENAPESPSAETTLLNGRYVPVPENSDGKIRVRTTAVIQVGAEALYAIWRNVEAAPQWQEQVIRVASTGATTSHWVMKSNEKRIEWDSEVMIDEPGKRIAWRSTGGESDNAGEVIFEKAPGGRGTMVTVVQEFRMGKIASAWETLVGRNPKQAVIENLRHFKALAETGEIPRTQGQPHGDRGVIGKLKESAYGEKTKTPPGVNGVAS